MSARDAVPGPAALSWIVEVGVMAVRTEGSASAAVRSGGRVAGLAGALGGELREVFGEAAGEGEGCGGGGVGCHVGFRLFFYDLSGRLLQHQWPR